MVQAAVIKKSAGGFFACPGKRMAVAAAAAAFIMAMGWTFPARAAGGLDLHTEYPGMSVKPGDSVSIPVSLDNLTGEAMDVDVAVESLPDGWEGYLQGGSYEVNRVYAGKGEDAADLTLRLTVPKELSEGTYEVTLSADGTGGAGDKLVIRLNASEAKAGKGSFTSEYPKQEGTTGTNFSFSTTLINNGLKPQSYSLSSNAPSGWTVSFTPSGETTKVAGIDVESGASQGINVAVTAPDVVDAGEYTINLSAVSAEETLSLDLTVTITGTYGLQLSTPDGRLSFDAYANRESDVTLSLTNTGNVDLNEVSLNSSAPSGWTVTYDQEDNVIDSIPAGTTVEVVAHVKPSSDAITGDYVTSFSAKTNEVSSSSDFRVSVKTSTMWGIVAVIVILLTASGLGYVFKKYGRR